MLGYTDINYADIAALKPTLYERLAAGDVFVIRGVPEIARLREILFETAEQEGGASVRAEIEDWALRRKVPSAAACAHAANALAEMRKAYLPPLLFSDALKTFGFPKPTVVENGAPRFQVPKAVEAELLGRTDILRRGVLENIGNDPSYHVMLISSHAVHRDLGRPCYHFQANFWCALQDLTETQALLVFPDQFRDPTLDRKFFKMPENLPDEPEDWGLGRVLRVPMSATDILVFSGDHVHCNPIQRGETLRLSWEFRVIGPCHDDVGWYRLGLFSEADFEARDKGVRVPGFALADTVWKGWKRPPASPLAYLAEKGSEAASAWQFLAWLVHHPNPDAKYVQETIEALKVFDFAEDRFFWPYFLAQKQFPDSGLHRPLLKYLVDKTESYFWACVLGGLALGERQLRLASRAFRKARALAAATSIPVNQNNIDYMSALQGADTPIGAFFYPMAPQDVDEVIRLYRRGAITRGLSANSLVPGILYPRDSSGRVSLIPGIPFPCNMFKPRFPFLEPKSYEPAVLDRLLGRAGDEITTPLPKRSFEIAKRWPPF